MLIGNVKSQEGDNKKPDIGQNTELSEADIAGLSSNIDTTILELYQITLKRAKSFIAIREDNSRTSHIRDHSYDRSRSLERDASCLAHCLAWFGNVKLRQLDVTAARKEVSAKICEGGNPWLRGLRVIEEELQYIAEGY